MKEDRVAVDASENGAAIFWEVDAVVYTEQSTEIWRVSLPSVAIIGEYTTTEGPFADDYFLVFVTIPGRQHFHASFYAVGRDAALAEIGQRLGADVQCGLCNSTDLVSRCMWPPQLSGQPLFRFTPVPVGGGWNRIRRMLSDRRGFDFTTEAERYLASLELRG